MNFDNTDIRTVCQKVLNDNWRWGYTIPSSGMYPHQWLWDSCFTAIGLRHFNTERARQELMSLARGQWRNGMLPNIIFASDARYHQDREVWKSSINPNSPNGIATTGITQPPMLAEAVVRVGEKLTPAEKQDWYKRMYPVLVDYHQWLYAERDPHDEGLVLQVHPYETGLDNTPPMIAEIFEHHQPWWTSVLRFVPAEKMINFFRRDLKHIPSTDRMSNTEVLLYYDIIKRLKRKRYDIERVLPHAKILFEDLTFNCILIRANKHLQDIAQAINRPLSLYLIEKMQKAESAIDSLWDPYQEEYFSRNFITHQHTKITTLACLMPLYSGAIRQERAKAIVKKLHDHDTFDVSFPVPSVPVNSKWFHEHKYWQGPTWLNTNWLIIQGLKQYGFNSEAGRLINSSLQLVRDHGPYEYFSPLDGSPSGARNFSWTAALAIDLFEETSY
ncbi:MAG TPA: trehalase family glycosidase [Candidatus Saccharimonadales bacterium]|nr:trehalase family glycosidase [Candidatus Saccharimonadales bacterium]